MAVAGDDLGAPLLRTKLVVPGSPRLVVRESLIAPLSEGVSLPLTLVYGPAGSGKTMLVAQWAASAREERPVAWLSLEADDNDPARFWMYVIAALRSVGPGIGEAALAMLRAPGVNLVAEALPALINELADGSEQFVLVLDDYHSIEDERIHGGMASLIEHLPTTLRIVMTSRAEPPLRVGTLRARAQLNEIGAGQLRFSLSEAESMLNDVHGLELTASAVKRLHDRTEGWAAGLYLAVLSMRGRDDASSFVASFTGSDRRVVDYLAAEVLHEQGDLELDFLLHTSVLDRFCAPLCDAITGAGDSRAKLDRVERANYFLIPLDPGHEWYRYHHLFGELLRHELERREPGRATDLHRLAGRWFLDAGMVSEAIGHLTAAGELDAASELIDDHWLEFTNAGQRETVSRWMDQLPRGYIVNDGRLCLAQARTALTVGERAEVLRWGTWPRRRRRTTRVMTRSWERKQPSFARRHGSCSATCVRLNSWLGHSRLWMAAPSGTRSRRVCWAPQRDSSTPTTTPKHCSIRQSSSAAARRTSSSRRSRLDGSPSSPPIAATGAEAPPRLKPRSVWSAQMVWRSTGSAPPPTSHGAAVPSQPAANRGTGRARTRGQPRSTRRWPGRVVVRIDDTRRAAARARRSPRSARARARSARAALTLP